jgi:DNA-binding transcriptional ArsR family regulator
MQDDQIAAIGFAKQRWGLAAEAGYQVIPDVLIRAHQKLGLDALDVMIILNISMHWWAANDLPYPRVSVIAQRLDISPRTVQRRLDQLQERGMVERLAPERKGGRTIRRFRLAGLVQGLEGLAAENLATRKRTKRQERNSDAGPPPGEEARA